MSRRAETLATEFEQANALLLRTIEGLTDDQWRARCSAEGWSVGVTAHHIVAAVSEVLGLVQLAAAGGPIPVITVEQMDAGNTEHARIYAGCTRAETVMLLQKTNQSGAAVVRGLTEEQLRRTIPLPGRDLTLEQVVTEILIGHVNGESGHLASIHAACAAV